MSDLTVRSLDASEYDLFFSVFVKSFLDSARESIREPWREVFDPEGAHGVFDGSELVGIGALFDTLLSLPGDTRVPMAAVTAVGVKPGHRRRGILTTVMRAQLHDLHENGSNPIAGLHTSEGAIYGRFGYGIATDEAQLSVPRGAAFIPSIEVDERRVREARKEEALEIIRDFYASKVPHRAGWLSKDKTWEMRVIDDRSARAGLDTLHYAMHPEGYALYRPQPKWTDRGPSYTLHIQELVAATPQSYAALCRYLLDTDLVGEVRWQKAAVDEPLLHLLADPRQATRKLVDDLWVRLVDIDRALPARRYGTPIDIIIEIIDRFCPWNAACWRFLVDNNGVAEVTKSDRAAQLRLDVTDLASAYLGRTTIAELGRCGRVVELEPGILHLASRCFATEYAPHCQDPF